jgi:hypothetical protein
LSANAGTASDIVVVAMSPVNIPADKTTNNNRFLVVNFIIRVILNKV